MRYSLCVEEGRRKTIFTEAHEASRIAVDISDTVFTQILKTTIRSTYYYYFHVKDKKKKDSQLLGNLIKDKLLVNNERQIRKRKTEVRLMYV